MQGPSCLSQTHGTLLIPPSCPHRAQERDPLVQVRLQHHTTRLFVGHSLVVGGMAPCTCNLCKQVVHTHTHTHTHTPSQTHTHTPTDTHSYTQYGNKPYAKCTRDHMHTHTPDATDANFALGQCARRFAAACGLKSLHFFKYIFLYRRATLS